MVQKGFNEVAKKTETSSEFKEIKTRLARIENILLKQHSQQIESLEKRINRLEEASVNK
ncbi:MAG: hypothetical protein WC845_02855 [Candidatus Staskawiczbacteria bacterium]|jgi:hypothetical protein